YVLRGGSLAAWAAPEGAEPARAWRLVGAHTDSPNLRVKPRADTGRAGLRQLGVEIYGGVLLNSWLDRDLALAGRAFVRGPRGPEERLFALAQPLLRVPQLAIHLNREISSEGLHLNPQVHMNPIFASDAGDEPGFRELLGAALLVEPEQVLSWDAMLHDAQPARLLGHDEQFVSSGRLDNLCSCFSALTALLARLEQREPLRTVAALAFFDHEEVGSTSSRGAQSDFLRTLLERSVRARGGGREELFRALASSLCLSADMAHATHPNYPEKHEPEHPVRMNGGPVIKINVNQRYASEGETEALFLEVCARAGVPCQHYVHRGDLVCGTTIGPLTAASLGVRTVDIGNPQLSMHSARELCGARDPWLMARAMEAFFE
ncbi:MAG: M18 family aminopeptidase, partial [Planctomycetes bacterium]|nr:M18 family aminopeptidase [Planctomycetota bacterium]